MIDKIVMTDGVLVPISRREAIFSANVKNASDHDLLNLACDEIRLNDTAVTMVESDIFDVLKPNEKREISAKVVLPSKSLFEFKADVIDNIHAEVRFKVSQKVKKEQFEALPEWSA
jgi:hypothetical protein